MENIDLIFEDEFMKSKEFKEWHESYVSAIKHALKPAKEFIKDWKDKYGELPKSDPITDDDPWLIKTKEEIIILKTDLIFKSIQLGIYFKELQDMKGGD